MYTCFCFFSLSFYMIPDYARMDTWIFTSGAGIYACWAVSRFFHSGMLILLLSYAAAGSLQCFSAGHRPCTDPHGGNSILTLGKENFHAVQITGMFCFVFALLWGGQFLVWFCFCHAPVFCHSLKLPFSLTWEDSQLPWWVLEAWESGLSFFTVVAVAPHTAEIPSNNCKQ